MVLHKIFDLIIGVVLMYLIATAGIEIINFGGDILTNKKMTTEEKQQLEQKQKLDQLKQTEKEVIGETIEQPEPIVNNEIEEEIVETPEELGTLEKVEDIERRKKLSTGFLRTLNKSTLAQRISQRGTING